MTEARTVEEFIKNIAQGVSGYYISISKIRAEYKRVSFHGAPPGLPQEFSVWVLMIDSLPVFWKGHFRCSGVMVVLPEKFMTLEGDNQYSLWWVLIKDLMLVQNLRLSTHQEGQKTYTYLKLRQAGPQDPPVIEITPGKATDVIVYKHAGPSMATLFRAMKKHMWK